MIRALLIVVSLAFLVAGLQVSLAHDHWINHGNYASPTDGIRCCGENDCFLVLEGNVSITPRATCSRRVSTFPSGRRWCRRTAGIGAVNAMMAFVGASSPLGAVSSPMPCQTIPSFCPVRHLGVTGRVVGSFFGDQDSAEVVH